MPEVIRITDYKSDTGADLSITSETAQAGDVRILMIAQRTDSGVITCSGVTSMVEDYWGSSILIRLFYEIATGSSFSARTVQSTSSAIWFCLDWNIRGLDAFPAGWAYSQQDSTSSTRRIPASPTYADADADYMPFGFAVARATYSNNSNWSGYFTATDPADASSVGSGTTGLYGLAKYKVDTAFANSFISTSWTAYATSYSSISFGWPIKPGYGHVRDGVDGSTIATADGVDAGDLINIDGVE